MKLQNFCIRLFLIISISSSGLSFTHTLNAQKKITIQKIFASADFYPYTIDDVLPMKDGEHYCILEDNAIVKYNYQTGEKSGVIVSGKDLAAGLDEKKIQIDNFQFSENEKKILISFGSEEIYRRSSISEFIIWDTESKQVSKLSGDEKLRLAEFSPDGSKVAYVKDNNLYYKDLNNNKDVKITSDGSVNKIINGVCDWVYEEEFEFSKAFYWSPDGASLAFYRFDESKVKEFNMEMWGTLYPELYTYKYPKAGEDNSIVDIYIYNINSGKTVQVNTGENKNRYIPWIQWTKNSGKLAVLWMNRLQNKQNILLADAATGQTSTIYTEENKYYIDLTDFILYFTNDGKSFIISNETSKFKHLYLYDLATGKLQKQLTTGEWEIDKLCGVDENKKEVYFTAAYSSPMNRDICSVNFNGKNFKVLSEKKGANKARFSKTFKYYIHEWSDANTPPYTCIRNIEGKELKVLEDNKYLENNIKECTFQNKEFFTFETSQGTKLNGWMIKPDNFNENKKYPVLFDIYGGPGNQTVLNTWEYMNAWHQLIASEGYIVVSVDNRGTGGRGEEFKKCTYLQLGKYETEDQTEAAKYLGTLPYVDKSRIGIWGWSFGGYLTLLCMTKGADYFSTGVAVAPVTNWRYYDNIYTERFMRTPEMNADGYDNNSPVNHVKKLKGKLLIAHGTADDNVHLQNTMELVTALVNANKQFEMQLYPNNNHGIYGGYSRIHLFTRITEFILKNL